MVTGSQTFVEKLNRVCFNLCAQIPLIAATSCLHHWQERGGCKRNHSPVFEQEQSLDWTNWMQKQKKLKSTACKSYGTIYLYDYRGAQLHPPLFQLHIFTLIIPVFLPPRPFASPALLTEEPALENGRIWVGLRHNNDHLYINCQEIEEAESPRNTWSERGGMLWISTVRSRKVYKCHCSWSNILGLYIPMFSPEAKCVCWRLSVHSRPSRKDPSHGLRTRRAMGGCCICGKVRTSQWMAGWFVWGGLELASLQKHIKLHNDGYSTISLKVRTNS